jgi:hypothetical protein
MTSIIAAPPGAWHVDSIIAMREDTDYTHATHRPFHRSTCSGSCFNSGLSYADDILHFHHLNTALFYTIQNSLEVAMTTRKRKKLVDRDLPAKADAVVPESRLYSRLLEFEQRLNATISRKQVLPP